jgi:hypothetical protein
MLSLALAGLALCAAAPAASASDLTIDGLTSVTRPMGSTVTVVIDGTPGATTYLFVGVDPGPSVFFGNPIDIGFSPDPIIVDLGPMPTGGTYSLPATIPNLAALDGLTIYMVAAVADAASIADYSYSPGANLTISDRNTQLAGNALGVYPFFEFVRAFNEGSSVSVAVDPSTNPTLVGDTADIYLVVSKDGPGWDADPSLTDVSNDGPDTHTFVAGTIQSNTVVVDNGSLSADAGADIGVGYDIVIDLDQDGQLDADDLIDGYGSESGLYAVHDLTLPGPYSVIETLYSGGTFLGQNLYYPSNVGSLGELPLVVVSHGNGHNYQWYDHIGYHLASYGFIVMSHQNNTGPGIGPASTTTLTNTDYFLGNLGTIAGGVLQGHVDDENIIWFGHSRGGEGIVRAYDRLYDGVYIAANFGVEDIKLLSSIAPTDFLGPNPTDPHDVDYHLWTGGSDSDVNGCANCDICQTFHLHDRAERKRMSISLHGVGHGDFHASFSSSPWATGPCLVGRETTHRIMRGYILPLVKQCLGNIPAKDYLWRQWGVRDGAGPHRGPARRREHVVHELGHGPVQQLHGGQRGRHHSRRGVRVGRRRRQDAHLRPRGRRHERHQLGLFVLPGRPGLARQLHHRRAGRPDVHGDAEGRLGQLLDHRHRRLGRRCRGALPAHELRHGRGLGRGVRDHPRAPVGLREQRKRPGHDRPGQHHLHLRSRSRIVRWTARLRRPRTHERLRGTGTMMKNSRTILPVAVLALLVAGVAWSTNRGTDEVPAAPADTMASEVDVVYAQPFVLDQPATHWWRAEQPSFSSGMLLVIAVEDRALVVPRQVYEPVLYVGAQTAEKINTGEHSGHLVIVVPAPLAADGSVDLDLGTTPIFFGEPALPEQITASIAQSELDRAVARGLGGASASEIAGAMQEMVALPDHGELHAYASNLVEAYSPQEVDLIAGLRAPRISY